MHKNYKEIITIDGSKTILNIELNETYHSTFGAVTESKLVFIKYGLENFKNSNINILEVGYGTGLNALLSFEANQELNNSIVYYGIDINEMTKELASINDTIIDEKILPDRFSVITAKWNEEYILSEQFKLIKVCKPIQEFDVEVKFDLIYFDAFSPDKQPEMWTEDIFRKMFELLKFGGILVTYSSKGKVKIALRNVGFVVKRLPGPPPKKHVLKAEKSIDIFNLLV